MTRRGRQALSKASAPVRPLPDIEAVVFDMDGLLLDTEVLALRSLRLAGTEIGIDLPSSLCHLMIGVPVDACRQLLFERYGQDAPADRLFAAAAIQLEAQVEAGLLRVKPGVVELLQYLQESDMPCAVATSSAREKAHRHLAAVGLLDRFQIVLTRDDVARGKPHPDLFLAAAQALSQPPHRCLGLEDSHNGVRAAHAAGMPVIMVPDLLAPTDEMRQRCHSVQADLNAVTELLRTSRSTSKRDVPVDGP